MLMCATLTDTKWKADEKRECRFVFIGRNLDKKALQDGFMDCKAEDPLRFKVGDKVQAQCGKWKDGEVIKLWNEGNPYRIRLDTGVEVFGPIDDPKFVRAPEAGA